MADKPLWHNHRQFSDDWYDARLGLPKTSARPERPVIFETKHTQDLLLRIARDGEVRAYGTLNIEPLMQSGMITLRVTGYTGKWLSLNPRYPAIDALRKVLAEMNGRPCAPIPARRGKSCKPERALGRRTQVPFILLRQLVAVRKPMSRREFIECFPEILYFKIDRNLERLVSDGVLIGGDDEPYAFSKAMPHSFTALIRSMAKCFGKRGEGMPRPAVSVLRPAMPMLFGSRRNQDILIAVARGGNIQVNVATRISELLKTGMLIVGGNPRMAALNPDHPAASSLRACLSELCGVHIKRMKCVGKAPAMTMGLPGNDGQSLFRVVHRLIMDGPLDKSTLRQRMPDLDLNAVPKSLAKLSKHGVLIRRSDGTFTLGPMVPPSFTKFILKTADWFGSEDPRIKQRSAATGRRVWSRRCAPDGAPRLFGTDLRLRNLMALAKYGPMLEWELRRVTGSGYLQAESKTQAPYGRGGIVRRWQTSAGPAVMLDPEYPLAEKLSRLLLRLEQMYPVASFVSGYEPLTPPERRAWFGDKNVIFGGAPATNVLLSIGVLGWTYQTLCHAVCIKPARKKTDMMLVRAAIVRMEREGILIGNRPHGAGGNVRILRINDAYPAAAELLDMIHAYLAVWPTMTRTVERKMNALSPKARAQLRNRGLWPDGR